MILNQIKETQSYPSIQNNTLSPGIDSYVYLSRPL